jgi:tetratricopeptide (TPR) repeat protein
MLLTLPLSAVAFGAPTLPPPPPAQVPQRSYTAEEEFEARALLGERFAEFAPNPLRAGASPQFLRQGEALYEAAIKMNPQDPRYPRFLAEVRQQLGDVDGEIAAWTAYRRILPSDRVAQLQIINLYYSRIETADAKIAYLKDLLTKPSLPDEVKAAVAAKAVVLLEQRSHSQAMAMLQQAAQFYPLPEVTYLQWRMLPADATRVQRFAAIIARLRSNPAQADAIAEGADILADAGLSDQALNWYMTLIELHNRSGSLPSPVTYINYFVELYRAGETASANEKLDAVLQALPDFADAWFLRLTMQRADASSQSLAKARDALLNRCNFVADRILKEPAATQPAAAPDSAAAPSTQPAGDGIPDAVEAAVRRARDADPRTQESLVGVIGDMTWFELYFDHKPEAALPWLNALKRLMPNDSTLFRRLQGWYDFEAGHPQNARQTFTALQDSDPLCALGLYYLEEQEKHAPESEAIGRKILSNPRGGVLGAILWQALKGRGLKPTTQPAMSNGISAELDKLPPGCLTAIYAPQRFYALRAEPLRNGRRVGEPLFAVVTIANVSKQDLTIGDNGLIKPVLWFDAQIRGLAQQVFPAVTFDRLVGTTVLQPGQTIQQVVRMDEGELGDVLRQRPLVTLFIAGGVVTNPVPTAKDVRAGPGGYSVSFAKMFTRTPTSLTSESARRKFFTDLQTGTPSDKLLDLEALAAYVRQYDVATATPQEKELASQYLQVIEQCQGDAAPGVKICASYHLAALAGPGASKVIDEMLASNSWESRLMGLIVARHLPIDAQKDLMARVAAKDADATVKAYAVATLALLQQAATQPAATQPATTEPAATQPAGAGGLQPATQPAQPGPPAAPEKSK